MRTITSRCRSVIDGASLPLRSPWHEAMSAAPNAPLTGGCNPGRILAPPCSRSTTSNSPRRRLRGGGAPLLRRAARAGGDPEAGADPRSRRRLVSRRGARAPHRRRAGLRAGAEGAPGLPGKELQRVAGAAAGRRRRGHRRRRDPRCPPLLRRRSVGQPDRADLSRIGRACRRRRAERASCRRRSRATGRRRPRAAPRRSRGRRSEQPSATA